MITVNRHKSQTYLFHPFEILICGYSNCGKTTLISKLIDRMKKDNNIGYIKHDVHGFQMDKPGKDSHRAWESGAHQVYIADGSQEAILRPQTENVELKSSFVHCDFVFVEGYKNSNVEKIVFIDEEKKILKSLNDSTNNFFKNSVLGFIGSKAQMNGLPVDAPYFHRDDVEGISQLVRKILRSRVPPILGLVLAGGRSKRMKTDKALLKYYDKPQAEICFELLAPFCQSCFISSRLDQGVLGHLPHIFDQFTELGPLGGILSAMYKHPKSAWMVTACDLPFVDHSILEHLVQNRNPLKFATCFQGPEDQFPQPLCSIYEPKMLNRFFQFLSFGFKCPRKALINSSVQILSLFKSHCLDNINTRDEFKKAKTQIQLQVRG